MNRKLLGEERKVNSEEITSDQNPRPQNLLTPKSSEHTIKDGTCRTCRGPIAESLCKGKCECKSCVETQLDAKKISSCCKSCKNPYDLLRLSSYAISAMKFKCTDCGTAYNNPGCLERCEECKHKICRSCMRKDKPKLNPTEICKGCRRAYIIFTSNEALPVDCCAARTRTNPLRICSCPKAHIIHISCNIPPCCESPR